MGRLRRKIQLYLPFAKAGIKTELTYKAQVFMWVIISFVEVFFILFLYGAIYRNSPDGMDGVINGFTYTDMVLYMITSFIVSFAMGGGETDYNIYTDIREGTIANTLTKPVSYRLRHLSTYLGMVSLDMLIVTIPLLVLTYGAFFLLGLMQVGILRFLLNLLFFFVFMILACFLNDAISYFIGMMIFFTEHLFGLNMARIAIQGFLSGKMVPLAYMGLLGVVFSYTPFAFLGSAPVLAIMGKTDILQMIVYIFVALAWIIVIEIINHLIFSYAMKRVVVQGG